MHAPVQGPQGWKRRLEDPLNTYYRYPIALAITRLLLPTPITPNQISLMQPVFAGAAGYLIATGDYTQQLLGVACFEFRSILDCVDGSLARAKKLSSPNGHAIDAMADWLGVVFLYLGIFWHLFHQPPAGYTPWIAVAVAAIALLQGAARSFASDYFKNKYLSIFERGRDESIETLKRKLQAAGPDASIFAHIDIFIMRMGHLSFEGEWFDPKTTRAELSQSAIAEMARNQDAPAARRVGFLWSISNGDAFLSFVIISIAVGQLWAGQLFFATIGVLWIAAVMLANVKFVRDARNEGATPELG